MPLNPKELMRIADENLIIKKSFTPNPMMAGGGATGLQAPMPGAGGAPQPQMPAQAPMPPMGGGTPPMGDPGAAAIGGMGGGAPAGGAAGGAAADQVGELEAMLESDPEKAIDMIIEQATQTGLPKEQIITVIETQIIPQLAEKNPEAANKARAHLESKHKGGEAGAGAGAGEPKPPEESAAPTEPAAPKSPDEPATPEEPGAPKESNAEVGDLVHKVDSLERLARIQSQQLSVLNDALSSLTETFGKVFDIGGEDAVSAMKAEQGAGEEVGAVEEEVASEPGAEVAPSLTESLDKMKEVAADRSVAELIQKLSAM